MIARATAILAILVVGYAAPARAQGGGPGRIEFAVGAIWTGAASMGTQAANETQANGSPRALFSSATELASAPGIEARAGLRITRRLEAEAAGSYTSPTLRVTTSADAESAAGITATERVQQFSIGGAAVWYVREPASGARTFPFATVGAGYVRQLHEAGTLGQSGLLYDVGGGVKQLLVVRGSRRVKTIGVRADIRARVRPRVLAVDDRTHVSPMLGASLFVRF